jgi:hypothetical protein
MLLLQSGSMESSWRDWAVKNARANNVLPLKAA